MNNDDDNTEDLQTLEATTIAKVEDIALKAKRLLAEYQQLNDIRESNGHGIAPGLRLLVQSIASEDAAFQKHLQRLRSDVVSMDDDDKASFLKRLAFTARSSNVPVLETSWGVIKRCRRLESLSFRFSRHTGSGPCPVCPKRAGGKCLPKGQQAAADVAQVEAVVEGGAEWIRIVGIGERRLLMHMAQGGWDWGEEDGSESGSDQGGVGEDEEAEECDVSVAVTVRQLVEAARANRHDYRPPRVHLLLTRITEGSSDEIDRFIRLLRRLGRCGTGPAVEVVVDCANSDFLAVPPPPPAVAFQNLLPNELAGLTSTLNLDCTILVALVSDVTHSRVPPQPWYRGDVARHIADELERGSSLVRLLYPALRGRRLVCAPAAARRFRTIVENIGSPTEVARLAVILGPEGGEPTKKSCAALLEELQQLSENPVEPDLRLPIEVVELRGSVDDIPGAIAAGHIPAVAGPVLAEMTELNQEIYMLGWAEGWTSVTTNNTLAKLITRQVEEHRTHNDEAGPKIWVYRVLRALATKGRPGVDESSVFTAGAEPTASDIQ